MFIDSELSNVLMIELRVEEARHNNFLVDMRVATKAALESRGLRKKFLSLGNYFGSHIVSPRKEFLPTKQRTMINAGCFGRH